MSALTNGTKQRHLGVSIGPTTLPDFPNIKLNQQLGIPFQLHTLEFTQGISSIPAINLCFYGTFGTLM
jgi:hypothetical protein